MSANMYTHKHSLKISVYQKKKKRNREDFCFHFHFDLRFSSSFFLHLQSSIQFIRSFLCVLVLVSVFQFSLQSEESVSIFVLFTECVIFELFSFAFVWFFDGNEYWIHLLTVSWKDFVDVYFLVSVWLPKLLFLKFESHLLVRLIVLSYSEFQFELGWLNGR